MLKSKCNHNLVLYSGVLAVAVIWLGLSICLSWTHLNLLGVSPFSRLGINRASAGLFTASLVMSAVLFIRFGLYLGCKLNLSKLFLTVFIISHCNEIVVGIVPYGGSLKTLHTMAAFGWGIITPLFMYLFYKTENLEILTTSAKYFWLAELAATIVGIGGFISFRKALPLFQLLIAIPFHGWIIYTTWTVARSQKNSANYAEASLNL